MVEAADLHHKSLDGAAPHIVGSQVTAVDCHGKALLTRFSSGMTLYSHNQLYGVWRVSRRGSTPRTNRSLRLALHTADHSARLYSATDISLWRDEELTEHPFLRRLGPDVLAADTSAETVYERLKDKRFRNRQLASLYLDQGFLAGIGNYLRSEIMFFAGIHPASKPAQLDRAALLRLARNTIRITERSYRTAGITLPSRLAPRSKARSGRRYERQRFAVFARAGLPCYTCGSSVLKTDMNTRRIYWCPECQPSLAKER